MAIEISSNLSFNNKTKNKANKQAKTKSKAETEAEVLAEHDRIDITLNARMLQQMHQAIAEEPEIDLSKVKDLASKIQNKQLEIQGAYDKRLKAASNIAEKILEMETLFS